MTLLWLGAVALAQDPEAVPDDLEWTRAAVPVPADDARNHARIGIVGGTSLWQAPAVDVAGSVDVHLTRGVAVHLEAGSAMATVLAPHAAERLTVLLPAAAIGLMADPVTAGALRPTAALEATATLWRPTAVAPGGRVRLGLDVMIAGPMALAVDGHAGVRVAPGLSEDVNATWSDVAPAVGARAGMVARW